MKEQQIQDLKDRGILLAWITGLLLLISLIWILTQPLHTNNLMRTVNNVLINNNDSRRLSAFIKQKAGKANLLGYWYSINNSSDKMFVFTFFQDGVLVPLGAIVAANGTVEEIIPLSAHAVQVFSALPESILQMYINRIEATARVNIEGDLE
ncbi:MAG: hypothetical protein FWD13_03140 [Treponema sp.]|nr:hypothetical protein [Treponema sp.]